MKMANIVTCDVEIVLLRNNQIYDTQVNILPHKNQLPSDVYGKLLAFAQAQVEKPDGIFMHLFYSGDFDGLNMKILKPLTMHEEEGRIIFKTQVQYISDRCHTLETLRKGVDGIFKHWSNCADVEYGLEKFEIVRNTFTNTYVKSIGTVYHNLLGVHAREA